MTPTEIVLIAWYDAAGYDGWQEAATLKPDVHPCQTVGFLMSENDETVQIAHTDGGTQVHGVFDIPRGCIKSIRKIYQGAAPLAVG